MNAAAIFVTLGLFLGRSVESERVKDSGTGTDDLVEYFCSKAGPVDIPEQTKGKIITLFKGNSFYENNQFCQWNLNAGYGHRLQVIVNHWEFQYAPQRALCDSYDHIKVTDDEDFRVSWCQILPIFQSPFYINSRGPNLTVIFESDQTTPKNHRYPGGRLSFESFDANSCPPNWINHNDTCFFLNQANQIWSDGQKTCNLQQANLASILSQEEIDFLKTSYRGFTGKLWFGLNDKSVYGNFKWIDNSSAASSFQAMNSIKADPFKHCGQLDLKKDTVEMADCETEASVLCRTTKGKVSKIYPIPLFKTDKGNEKDSKTSRGLLLGVLIPCVVLLLLIILAIVLYRCRDNFSCFSGGQNHGKRSAEGTGREEFSLTQPSAPEICDEPNHRRLTSSQHIEPPTYEEALRSSPI